MSKISQREARRLRRRVTELEGVLRDQRVRWASSWPSGTVVARITPDATTKAIIQTARKLEHAVVAVIDGDNLAFFACDIADRNQAAS
jgi:hypothetical protein